MNFDRFRKNVNMLPDSTDLKLIGDADLNNLWKNHSAEKSPSERFTPQQVEFSQLMLSSEQDWNPPSHN